MIEFVLLAVIVIFPIFYNDMGTAPFVAENHWDDCGGQADGSLCDPHFFGLR